MPKVLSVEDDFAIAELVRRWLEEEDYEVFQASDGDEAIELVAEESPDVVLMDINLGEFSVDGWEINRRLKQDPSTQKIPVIALTAHAQLEEHRARALREGFAEHLPKPITYDALLQTVGRVLGQGQPT